jgi:SAM-dependent methyltransferase
MFNVSDAAYDRFMGRYSMRLAPLFADFAGVEGGQRVLDVGAGTGALTAELVRRGADVAAADPSPPFVEALRRRLPGIEVEAAPAEELPWPDESFDAVLAQLVIGFVSDQEAAAAEFRRSARTGGVVAVCMWMEGGLELARPLRDARLAVAPEAPPPPVRYRSSEEMEALLAGAGLRDVETGTLEVASEYDGFDDFWAAASGMVGPDTAWMRDLDDAGRERARDEVYRALGSPAGSFTLGARAAAVRATRA